MTISKLLLPEDNPLKESVWIWPEATMYLINHYAQFRHDFGLKIVPEHAPLYITADKAYRLYVNGHYVCRGPARGYQDHWPYDEVDLVAFLNKGHNWISVEAYNPGISTFQYLHCARAGFICAADLGETKIRTSTGNWLMRRSPAQRVNIARLSPQIDFQEDFDAGLDKREWIYSSRHPEGWNPDLFPGNVRNIHSTKFGQPPYSDLEPRGIPLLRERLIKPLEIRSTGKGNNAAGYDDCFNICWHWQSKELGSAEWNKVDLPVSDRKITFEPVEDGEWSAVTVDFGQIEFGTITLDVNNAAGGEIIDLQYFQFLPDSIPIYNKIFSNISLANRLRLCKGKASHDFFHPLAARCVTLIGRKLSKPLEITITLRTAEYPLSFTGSFESSDMELNQIYKICQHSQQLCVSDAFVDTPWREQAQWWGDARVQGRNLIYLDGDTQLLVRGIRTLAGQRGPHGLTFGLAPSCSGWVLPDFSLTWVMTIWDYYWQTGDLSLFHEQHKRIREILAYFESPEINSNGLLLYDTRYWLFEDWSKLPKEGIPTFLNLWHLYTLIHYAKLLEAASENTELEHINAQISRRRHAIGNSLWDSQRHIFIPGIKLDGTVTGEPSIHDQVLAILLDLFPEFNENMFKTVIVPWLENEKIPGAAPSIFWMTYLFECLDKLEQRKDIIKIIRKYWSPMIPIGSTWEEETWNPYHDKSCCHAWTAHPIYHFVNILGGIRQLSPRWEKVAIDPEYLSELNFSSVELPTPSGKITVNWNRHDRRCHLEISIPPDMAAVIKIAGDWINITGPSNRTFVIMKEKMR